MENKYWTILYAEGTWRLLVAAWIASYNHGHNILRYNIISPQVNQRVFISNKRGIYELPHELPNNLRL